MDSKLWFLPAAILAALICACSGGNSVSQSVAKAASPTARQVSQADLPNMVLTSGDMGAAYTGFAVDSAQSGPQTRDDRINDACDPQKQASELDATRWVAGYDTELGPTSGASPDGTFLIVSSVDLFEDANGSAEAFQQMIADSLGEANTECQGVNIGNVKEFAPPIIGDESWGSDASFTVPSDDQNLSGVLTTVIFRQGQVIVSVWVMRLGDAGAPDEAVRLAKALVERTS
jgi:hypothetical protein